MGRARFQWAPCAAVALHYLTARGVGSEVSPEVAHYPSVALGPSVLGRLRLSDVVGLAASLGLELQTARPRLVLEGLGEIEQIGVLELTSHASPLEFTEHSARLELLQTLLAGLTEAKREVFILAELEEMTVPEIAAALDIPLNTAYSRLRHARQEFEAALARHTAASKTRGSA